MTVHLQVSDRIEEDEIQRILRGGMGIVDDLSSTNNWLNWPPARQQE